METFAFNPPIELPDECKFLLAVTSFEATIFVLNITDEYINFSKLYQVVGEFLTN